MSKAYSERGILYLEQEGKINLEDDIKQYIPWLSFVYDGEYKNKKTNEEASATIHTVLYQTTEIPFQTVGYIHEDNTGDMLEKTVRTLVGTKLDFYPGARHSYATINYDMAAV